MEDYMTDKEIFEKLCYNDIEGQEEKEEQANNKDCYCDNCFYGRTRLAEYILYLKGIDKKTFIDLNK